MPETTSSFLEHASKVASSYGFRPLRNIDADLYRTTIGRKPVTFDTASIICAHNTSTFEAEPVLAQYVIPFGAPKILKAPECSRNTTPFTEECKNTQIATDTSPSFCLQVSGSPNGMSEIIIMRTITAILTERGIKVERVRINTVGDRDSRERFQRELSVFVKRRFTCAGCNVPENLRAAILENPIHLFDHANNPEMAESIREAPQPIHCLSERARTHLRGVLENLEFLNIPYEIDGSIFDRAREPRLAFRFDIAGYDGLVTGAYGGRCDEYVTRITGRRENATVHAAITFAQKRLPLPTKTADRLPYVYMVHLGWRAKLHGLTVVDILRKAGVPATHVFDASRVSMQLEAARKADVRYIMIMGEREARDGTVIVRQLHDNSQQTIAIKTLPRIVCRWK